MFLVVLALVGAVMVGAFFIFTAEPELKPAAPYLYLGGAIVIMIGVV